MKKFLAALVRYEQPLESVRRAIELCRGLDGLSASDKVFIKPNILTWTRAGTFPKWGALTTSRVVEDVIVLLKERGVDRITVAEGMVLPNIKDQETQDDAFEKLGYNTLKKRYGIKWYSVWERPFEKVDLGEGLTLGYNADALQSDFMINIPVLKTHNSVKVSLGIKNLKGLLDIPSRKKCHEQDSESNLHTMLAKLPKPLPPCLTILDGIYTLERGPTWEGSARRSNLLVASTEILTADMVGAKVLGIAPGEVPYLVHCARAQARPFDLSDVEIRGEKIEEAASPHEYRFPYNAEGDLPLPFDKMGIRGLSYPQMDLTLCTYCSLLSGPIMTSIARAWKGLPWDEVEILTGKIMEPTPGKNKTILIGKCMYQANKDHPHIREMIAVKGCPPSPRAIIKAFHQAGIEIDPVILEHLDNYPVLSMKKYKDNPEFDEAFFKVS